MTKKILLDLFSGLEGFSQAFHESDEWRVVSVELDPKEDPESGDVVEPTIQADVLDLTVVDDDQVDGLYEQLDNGTVLISNRFDVVLASPPCTSFSMGSVSTHWDNTYIPLTDTAESGRRLVRKTANLIQEIEPSYWFVENPTAMLAKHIGPPTGRITWCQYIDDPESVMKRTDLWGVHPASFCYRECPYGADCHVDAPRGSNTGTQGKSGSEERAKIPYGVSEEILEAIETDGLDRPDSSLRTIGYSRAEMILKHLDATKPSTEQSELTAY